MLRLLNLFFLLFLISTNQITAQIRYSTFEIEAPQLQTKKRIWVYLPLNYEKTTRDYPVIYMHDAQILFEKENTYTEDWNIDETLDSLNANVIVIGVEYGNETRSAELTPYKNKKYRDTGNADAYLEFIVKTLKPHVDATFRTKTNAKNTCIWGSSLGGLVSLYAALQYPDVFGKVGCFSPAFWINKKEISEKIESVPKLNTKIYFLCGDNEDNVMVKDMEDIETLVNSKRCECKKLNKSVIIKGGEHNAKLWGKEFAKAYLWLF